MSTEPGRVLRKGKIRVDARKAITKLRDHLLVDLHLYAVEVVRAAALAGARRVDVAYDADDVIIAFDGRALDPSELPRLFEHLTGSDEGDEVRFPRLLALAVNAALGLAPSWVSVTTCRNGSASRVLFTPELMRAIEVEERDLPEPETIAQPSDMPATGTRFQLRRKVGWEVVRRAAAKNAPREVTLLAAAATLPRAPIFLNGVRVEPPRRASALARAPFQLPGARTAYVEITSTIDVAPYVEMCELGVLLTRAGLAFGRYFPMAGHFGAAPPVRVVVDADALPLNASRSSVREDAPLVTSLAGAAAPALSDAIMAIAAKLFGRGSVPEGVTVDEQDRSALEDALGAFLCSAEASLTAHVHLPDALRALLDLPLFRDGAGHPMSHAQIPRTDPLLVWAGKEPLPEEMQLWAGGILWRQGRAAERILANRKTIDPQALAEIARRGAIRYRQLLATPAAEPHVPDDNYLCRERFSFQEGPLAGLSGEVAVASNPKSYVRNMGLRVFFQGRCFQTFPIPDDAVPLPCLISIAWPGHITPKLAYDGVEMTHGLRAALAYSVRLAVLLCERIAAGLVRQKDAPDGPQTGILRAALATAVLAPTRIYSLTGYEMPPLAQLPGLVQAPVWPTLAGFASLHTLCEYASKTGAVCIVAPATAGSPPDDRPVVRLGAPEGSHLRACLHPDIKLVQYDAAMAPPGQDPRRRTREHMISYIHLTASESDAPVMALDAPGHAGFVTLGSSEVRIWHGAAELTPIALDDTLGGVTVAISDDSIVPDERWSSVLYSADQGLVGQAERTFAERLTSALLGDATARIRLFQVRAGFAGAQYSFPADARDLPQSVRRYLIDRAARGRSPRASEAERDIAARIGLIPLLTMIGPDGLPQPASLSNLDSTHPEPRRIAHIAEAPPFRPVRWQPIITKELGIIAALTRWSNGRTRDVTDELTEQHRLAEREAGYTVFLRRPAAPAAAVSERGDSSGPVARLAPSEGVFSVTAALPAPGIDITHALVEVTYDDRSVCEAVLTEVPIPLVARVAVRDRAVLDGWDSLSSGGRHRVAERARQAAVPLALAVLERASGSLTGERLFNDSRALSLVLGVLAHEPKDERITQALRSGSLLWPTVQGPGRPFGQLRYVDGAMWAGTLTYSSWIAASPPAELDKPILHVPPTKEGSLLVAILERMGVKIRPVSDAIASLQAKRSKGSHDALRLAERPVSKNLSGDLAKVFKGLEGEVGIYESGEAIAEIHTLDGNTKRIPMDLPFPARAVARTELMTHNAAESTANKVAQAAIQLLMVQTIYLESSPLFVRSHLRAHVCRLISKSQAVQNAARTAPIFQDIDGKFWTLEQIESKEHGDWSCTFDPPPYPQHRQEGHTLMLTPAEHLQLRARVAVLNVTEWMRKDLEGERRRSVEPAQAIVLDASLQSRALSIFEVREGSLHGEIGILRPDDETSRGAHVFISNRPVCKIDDAPGWPLAAALNDDTLHSNRWFNEIWPAEETRLRARIRKLAVDRMRTLTRVSQPPDCRGEMFLDGPVPPTAAYGSTELMHITGTIYLPRSWPVAPPLRLWVLGQINPLDQGVEVASAPIAGVLPLCGILFVSHREAAFGKGSLCRIALHLRQMLEKLLAPLAKDKDADPDIAAYLWNVALLGGASTGLPPILSADGKAVTAEEVSAALSTGEIWITDQRGSVDGEFPVAAPPFVLRDEPSPLLRVLRARLPTDRIQKLGGSKASERHASLAPPSEPAAGATDIVSLSPAECNRAPSRSWLGSVFERVSGALSSRPAQEQPTTALGPAVERALRALRLRDEPVIVVREDRKGRLLRYDKSARVITINIAHPALAKVLLAPSPAGLRRACLALTAAALTEVNLALESITDHDECEAILELLRQDAAAAGTREAAPSGGDSRPA